MRWIIRIGAAFMVLVVLAVGIVLLLPSERIAQIATERLAAQTGREVSITGDVRPTLWPDLGVEISGIEISNPDWAGPEPLVQAAQVNVAVAWSGLLSGDIQVQSAQLNAATVTLVRNEDGLGSWVFEPTSPTSPNAAPVNDTDTDAAPAPPGTAATLGIDQAQLVDGRLSYTDRATGAAYEMTDLNATITLPEPGGAVTLAATGALNGTALDLSATIAGAAGLLAGEVQPVRADLSWPGGATQFDGRASINAALEGALSLEATDLAPILQIVGAAMPELPLGFGRDLIGISGDVTLAQEGSVHLRRGSVRLDQTRLNMALDLLPGEERPLLRGTITGGEITLPGLMASGGGAGGGGGASNGGNTAPQGWPRDEIDVSGLFAVDAEMTIRAESLDLGSVAFTGIDLRANIDAGRLVFDIAQIGTYGGTLAGRFVVNGRGGLSLGGDLVLANTQLQPLLQAMAGYDRLVGTGSASLEFLAVGDDLHTLMDGLEGEGDLSLGAGAIEGLDLAGMIRNFDTSFRGDGARTVYDQVTADFLIRSGVVLNDDLLLDAPWGEVRGEGQADLAAMSLDYRVTPGLMRDDDGVAGLQVPILIDGPWANLRIRPDLEALAEQELGEQAERLEAEARERLEEEARNAASDLLGVEIEPGASPNDIQDLLENGATEGIQRLLFGGGGGNGGGQGN